MLGRRRKLDPRYTQEAAQLALLPPLFKAFLRDLLFREAGKPYFKRLAIPRQRRWFEPWHTLSTYQAERHLLPVGGRHTDQLIQQFFTTYSCLRAEFQEGGMPVTAIHVLQQHCPMINPSLEQIQSLECSLHSQGHYQLTLTGGLTVPRDRLTTTADEPA